MFLSSPPVQYTILELEVLMVNFCFIFISHRLQVSFFGIITAVALTIVSSPATEAAVSV